MLPIVYDAEKNKRNVEKHGIALADALDLKWETLHATRDDRFAYGEERFIGYGMLKQRLHAIVYTQRGGKIRVISLRKANKRERKYYETL